MDDLFEHQMESERDKAINGFYTHFMIFLAVVTGLAIINLIEGDKLWVQWVVLGWGAGIALHAYLVFIRKPQLELKLREIRRANEKTLYQREPAEVDTPPVTPPSEREPGSGTPPAA
jgi:hypothetical protein